MNYRVLALPNDRTMTPASLREIRRLVFAGATVVGEPPQSSPSLQNYPACDAEIASLAREIWGDAGGKTALHSGRVFRGATMQQVFTTLNLRPDFAVASTRGGLKINFIHRRGSDGAEIYFVANQRSVAQDVTCSFRVAGKVAQLWHADSGRRERAPVVTQSNGITTLPLHFDPAGSVFVVFRDGKSDVLASVSKRDDATAKAPQHVLKIVRATYEATDGAGSADVTEKVAALAEGDTLVFNVDNVVLGGDPTPLHAKRLRVDYSLDGKAATQTVLENETLEIAPNVGALLYPAYEWGAAKNGATEMRVWENGEYSLRYADGKTAQIAVKNVAPPQEISGAWQLRFPPNWGAPPQITFPKLMSWTDSDVAGVRYFSGTATYFKTLNIAPQLLAKNRALFLDLGVVKNVARVKLNGRDLGILWKPPFRANISEVARAGANELQVEITNLWPNRLIGDEQLPDDVERNGAAVKKWPQWFLEGKPSPTGRLTFSTWKYWNKDSPLLESGLIGPVTLRAAQRVAVKTRATP